MKLRSFFITSAVIKRAPCGHAHGFAVEITVVSNWRFLVLNN
jgi:hypothetical protein